MSTSNLSVARKVEAADSGAHPELGAVRWGRDLNAALAQSRASGKPVAVLFDEVPGCARCVGFGEQVLSQPLIVDAIESEFEPVFVHNNREGADAAMLARFHEPASNNPVLRFLDAEGRDVIPRRDALYAPHEIAARLAEALRATRRPVPAYLDVAIEETHLAGHKQAVFGMSCFWEGEAALGRLDGVVATEAVWLDGKEAVEVTFDSTRLSFAALTRAAVAQQAASHVFARDDRQLADAHAVVGTHGVRTNERGRPAPEADRKFYLSRSPLRALPLSPLQATRINAALHEGSDALRWLSPRQRERAKRLTASR
ncbi:MAG: hypothetical protein HOP12_10855 [Candidatus Eisenbacteria bacterium]|uniref:Peptide-methionine (S)-S-oxide reductase n=1 Tax=Eiseniibacteriota bacterium TaxID=2212470 RepID=A0A849SGZ5_UNCEI|nr:hypothetical protein [Candidatus Eisenbacteria bacterium]